MLLFEESAQQQNTFITATSLIHSLLKVNNVLTFSYLALICHPEGPRYSIVLFDKIHFYIQMKELGSRKEREYTPERGGIYTSLGLSGGRDRGHLTTQAWVYCTYFV